MLCSLLPLARRLITHELGEQHSQSTGNNHEYAIIQQWKSARFTENESTNVSDNQPRRAEASTHRPDWKNDNRKTQRCGGSRMIKIHSAVPVGGESKKKVSRLADRLSGKKACLVVRVNHSVVSVANTCCCDV